MLSFLYVAYRAGVEVVSYEDTAVGTMAMNEHNKKWVNAVELHPKIVYGRNPPTSELEAKLHDEAHHECFIANSVKTDIRVAAAPR
jgi:organic hydroperoxide reductase OsmC/OhrA